MTLVNAVASHGVRSRSKLKAWPSPSGRANATRRCAATHASATAIRGGSYSSNSARQAR